MSALRLHPVLASLGVLFALWLQGCGPSPESHLKDDPYPYQCLACKHSFTKTLGEVRDMQKRGETVAPANQYLKIKCPSCSKIEASYQDNRTVDYGEEPGS